MDTKTLTERTQSRLKVSLTKKQTKEHKFHLRLPKMYHNLRNAKKKEKKEKEEHKLRACTAYWSTSDNYLKRKIQRTKVSQDKEQGTQFVAISRYWTRQKTGRFAISAEIDGGSMGKRGEESIGCCGMTMEKGRRSSSYLLPVAWPCT